MHISYQHAVPSFRFNFLAFSYGRKMTGIFFQKGG